MSKTLRILRTTVWLASVFFALTSFADERILLGDKHVRDISERDTIHVDNDRGAFTFLQVSVAGSAVQFKQVVIHFENGSEQELPENRVIRAGGHSRMIKLQHGPRHIDRVVFYYEARSPGWKGAQIKLWGVR